MRIDRRGGALLTVLWLSAALSAIAFSVATTVRGETERTSTSVSSLKAYYLACGAIERAMLYIEWAPLDTLPDGRSRYFNWEPALRMPFPGGEAVVEVIPETAKLGLNTATGEELNRLLLALGVSPERSQEVAAAIIDWRTARPPDAGPSVFDSFYLGRVPSFQAAHASFEEVEELLLVKGMTPELFYGTLVRGPEGRLIRGAALRDCVTAYGGYGMVDVNTAEPAVLAAVGLPPESIQTILAARRLKPFTDQRELEMLGQNTPAVQRLRIGGNTIFTLRATARLRLQDGRLSDDRRSVAAVIKRQAPPNQETHLLRWYDNVWAH